MGTEEKLHENDVWDPNREVPILSCILACVLSHFSRVQLCVTPWTVAHQAALSVGFSRQGPWSGLPCPPPGDLPNPGIEPKSPALQADSLPAEPQGKPIYNISFMFFLIRFLKSDFLEKKRKENRGLGSGVERGGSSLACPSPPSLLAVCPWRRYCTALNPKTIAQRTLCLQD